MYNKKAIQDALAKLNSAKKPKQEPDIIVDPNINTSTISFPQTSLNPIMKSGGTNKVSVKKSLIDKNGKGLFAEKEFKKNQLIGLAHEDDQPVGKIGNMHNHSDNPNMYSVKAGNRRYVYAKTDIQSGEELTTNYRLQPELEQPEDFMREGGFFEYTFPGNYVDEFPMMQGGGQTIYVDPNDPAGRARYQAYQRDIADYNRAVSHPEARLHSTGLVHFIDSDLRSDLRSLFSPSVIQDDGSEGKWVITKPDEVKYKPNPEIVAKQQQLIDAGYNIGKADGIWGPKSKAAWKEFEAQQENTSKPKVVEEIPEQEKTTTSKEKPKGLTKQVPKTEWKQLPDGTWYKDTKAGHKADTISTGVDVGGRKLKYGGEEPQIKESSVNVDAQRKKGLSIKEGYDKYQEYQKKLAELQQLKEQEQERLKTLKSNVINIAKDLEANPRPTKTSLDYLDRGAFYCNTRSCEVMRDAGYTIPKGTEPFTLYGKTYNPGDPIPIIPGNIQMQSFAEKLGFIPAENDLEPGDWAQQFINSTSDYQGNTFSERSIPKHSMIYAGNNKYWNAVGGSRTHYDKTPISYGDVKGYKYQGSLPYYSSKESELMDKLKPYEKYRRFYENTVDNLPVKEKYKLDVPEWHVFNPTDLVFNQYKYGGLTTGLTNTSGNLLMNNKGKRIMAQSGSLSATNELFLGNPLVTKRKRAVYVPGKPFQEGGSYFNNPYANIDPTDDIEYKAYQENPYKTNIKYSPKEKYKFKGSSYIDQDFKNKAKLAIGATGDINLFDKNKLNLFGEVGLEGYNYRGSMSTAPQGKVGVKYNIPSYSKSSYLKPKPFLQEGGSIELELTPEEIEEYRKGGFVVEEI